MTPLAPPPAPPMVPRLVEDVVPDDRDDPEIILNTTTVNSLFLASAGITLIHFILLNTVGCVVAKKTHGQCTILMIHLYFFSVCSKFVFSIIIR